MSTRAQSTDDTAAAGVGRRASWSRRLGAALRSEGEEDGVFRPVRMPLWIDLGIALAIVLAAAAAYGGFFLWLARTQAQ